MNAWDSEFYDSNSNIQYQLGFLTLNELNIQDGETILDIGCGTGRLTIEIAKRTPSGSVIGLDNNFDMIVKAIENLKSKGLKNIHFITGDILLYKPEIQFDAIFSNSALHWILKTRALYQQIYAILAPGGRFVAQVPTKGSLDHFISIFLAPIHPLNLSIYFKNWKYPVKLMTPNTLQKLLTTIGFSDIQIWMKNQKLEFNSPKNLLDFLQSATLVPFLSQIPPIKSQSYLNYLLNIFKTHEKLDLSITMKRLILKAKKESLIKDATRTNINNIK